VRHEATVSGDGDRFAAFDIVEELRQVGFGFGGLDFAHADSSK
jgi:hypothetical protein